MAVTVPVDIVLRIEEAVRQAAQTSDQISKQLGKIDKTADRTSKAVNAISFIEISRAAIDFGRTVVRVLGDVIQEAIEADDAFNSLANSLKASGDFSEQNVRAFERLADSLAATSRFDDDLILSQVRLGKQFGLTNREVARLIEASVEYASFTGEDLTTAVRQLGQTFDGTAGRLAEQIPALRNLSKESLRAGGAIDLVLKNFGGSRLRDIETFSGALQRTENQFGSIFENIGRSVVANPAVIQSLKAIGDVFAIIADAISDSEGTFRQLVTGSVQLAIQAFGTLLEILAQIDRIATSINRFFSRSVKTATELGAPLSEIQKIKDKIERQDNRQNFLQRLITATATASGNIDRYAQKQDKVAETQKKIADGFDDQINKNRVLIEQEEQRLSIQEEFNRVLNEEFQRRQGILRQLTQNPFGERDTFQSQNRLGLSFDRQQQIAQGVGIAGQALRGADGARQLVSQAIEVAGKALLGVPGLGELASLLSQGPEQVRELVKQFADALPEVITAIAEAIPVVLETLAEKLPDIITKLVENAPRIIVALARAIPTVAFVLAREIGRAALQFTENVIGGAAKFVGEILKGAFRFIDEIVRGIGDALSRLVDNLNPFKALGIGGGGDNPAGGAAVGAGIGFAVGGPVGAVIGGIAGALFGKQGGPQSSAGAGFSGSQSRVSSSGQPLQINLKVGARELATVMTDIKRQGFAT